MFLKKVNSLNKKLQYGYVRIGILGEISRLGGGQVYMKSLINALKNNDLTLISNFIMDPLNISELVNNKINVNYFYRDEDNYIKVLLKVLKLKKELININKKFDLLINNHPNIFLKKGNLNIFHGMSFLDPIIDEYGNVENKIILNLIKISGIFKLYNNANFIVNSEYTRGIVEKTLPLLNLKVTIIGSLYPTFNFVNKISTGNKILIFGRINKRKNIDQFLNVAGKINKKVIIAGAVNEGQDFDNYKYLKKIAPENVEFYPNPDEGQKEELFLKSKIYVHISKKEHFGISVVEAMSHGLIPVVPKSGGPWIDIINKDEYGLGYDNYNDIPDCIDKAYNLNDEFKKNIINSVDRFSENNFKNNLNEIINKVNS